MIIFFDIDGTLIGNEDHIMPESAKDAIRQARANGHICIINTGRAGNMVGPEIRNLVEMDGYLFGCGTMVEYRGEILFHQTFTRQEARDIIEGLRRHRIDAVLEGAYHTFCPPEEEAFTEEFADFCRKWVSDGYKSVSWEGAEGHFDKFYCYMGEQQSREAFMAEFADRLDFIDREQGYYEVTPKGFSKASGMEKLAELLGISMADTAAIGDSNNDLSMLACASKSIAMKESSEEVLKIADFVTTDVHADGIRNALMWLGVI